MHDNMLLLREPYTEWQRNLYGDMSVDELYAKIKAAEPLEVAGADVGLYGLTEEEIAAMELPAVVGISTSAEARSLKRGEKNE
jgi:hypothetical protein